MQTECAGKEGESEFRLDACLIRCLNCGVVPAEVKVNFTRLHNSRRQAALSVSCHLQQCANTWPMSCHVACCRASA